MKFRRAKRISNRWKSNEDTPDKYDQKADENCNLSSLNELVEIKKILKVIKKWHA